MGTTREGLLNSASRQPMTYPSPRLLRLLGRSRTRTPALSNCPFDSSRKEIGAADCRFRPARRGGANIIVPMEWDGSQLPIHLSERARRNVQNDQKIAEETISQVWASGGRDGCRRR